MEVSTTEDNKIALINNEQSIIKAGYDRELEYRRIKAITLGVCFQSERQRKELMKQKNKTKEEVKKETQNDGMEDIY